MDEPGEPFRFRSAHAPTETGQSVVATALVVPDRRPARQLFCQPCVDEALEGAIQRGWSHPDQSAGGLLDPPHDGVAMKFPLGESYEHVELRRREREEWGRIRK